MNNYPGINTKADQDKSDSRNPVPRVQMDNSMKFIVHIERLQDLVKLIRTEKTGTPEELAKRLGISRSQLYNLLAFLNDIGTDITYSRRRRSFRYSKNNAHIEIDFSIKVISDNESYKIHGRGQLLNFIH